MAKSDAILRRLLALHPKIIDLSLGRMVRLLASLGSPERRLPPVIHVAGTNGKGSTVAYLRAMVEAAGLKAHVYTSPHLVKFHERIRIAGELIPEAGLSALLEECEVVNGSEPITFFEITTAAAFLAFSRNPADYLILEVGLGGRLDATNVVERPKVAVITAIDYDHQQYLGDTLTLIAHEKAGILKRGAQGIIGRQHDEARAEIERVAARLGVPLRICQQDWQVHEQHGRLVYQDIEGLLDLPLPKLRGRHQIDNAGNAVAAIRALGDGRIADGHIALGLTGASWPARMQKLGHGALSALVPTDAELWLDGGHNPSGGAAIAETLADLNARRPLPLILVWAMLGTKDAGGYIANFAGLAASVIALTIPDEPNAAPAAALADVARAHGIPAETASSLEDALRKSGEISSEPRILMCGSLYFAGHVLAAHGGERMSEVSGAAGR